MRKENIHSYERVLFFLFCLSLYLQLTVPPVFAQTQQGCSNTETSAHSASENGTTEIELFYPLFQYPFWYLGDTPDDPRLHYVWDDICEKGPNFTDIQKYSAVINYTNGPGKNFPNIDFSHGLTDLETGDIDRYGYVYTGYGERALSEIFADIDNWLTATFTTTNGTNQEHIAINSGIFIDESSSDIAHLDYYKQIINYIESKYPTSEIVLNPGRLPDQEYFKLGARIIIFEGYLTEWESVKNTYPDWLQQYIDQNQAIVIVHTVPSVQEMCEVFMDLTQLGVHAAFVTDHTITTDDNPYNQLPSYFLQMMDLAEGKFVPDCAENKLYLPNVQK